MVSSIGSFNAVTYAASAGLTRPAAANTDSLTSTGSTTSAQPSAADTFMAYMKKSPMERMIENWLKAHKLDQDKLNAMSPEERDAVMKQMKQEIEDQLKRETENKGDIVNVLA